MSNKLIYRDHEYVVFCSFLQSISLMFIFLNERCMQEERCDPDIPSGRYAPF